MRLKFRSVFMSTGIAVLSVGLSLALSGCQSKGESAVSAESKDAPAPAAKPAPRPDVVQLDQSNLANITLETVREQMLPRTLTATGKVQFNDEQTSRVLSPLAGQVEDLRVHVGDKVAKDQELFSIKSRDVSSLVTDYIESQREQDLADKTYNMTKDLFDHQAASRMSLQQAEADLDKAKAHVSRADEALRVFGLDAKQVAATSGVRTLVPVRAALAGTVIERPVTPGQFVQGDSTPLITIADMSTVWVMVDVFETDLHLVKPGQRVMVTATAYPNQRFTAKVDRINDRLDPETRTIKVRLLVTNPGELLKPEMFITASLQLNESATGVTIPAKAVFSEGDHSYAFVAVDDRRFERREVTAAADGSGRLRVSSGIKSGDRVVTDGALLLRFRQQEDQQPD